MSSRRLRVAVVGAGAFGGWTALALAERGADVTLIDAWGPGHARASSGGRTRIIRAAYGTRTHYTAMAITALACWRAREAAWGHRLLHRTGALWMFAPGKAFAGASEEALRGAGVPIEVLTPAEAHRRFPQIDFAGTDTVLFEPEAGYLLARQACRTIVHAVAAAGGTYVRGAVPVPLRVDERFREVTVSPGHVIAADAWVFACGAWLGGMFPDVVGGRITATRQEVHYFGTPAGDPRFDAAHLPVWLDFAERQIYGVPDDEQRGFKIADDTAGPVFDPTDGERHATAASVAAARAFLSRRFPLLAAAPLLGTEVCQYEATPDADFLIDRHPRAANVWIVGGGSGHGFKMGPAVGEMVASQVLGHSDPDPRFGLARLAAPPAGGWQEKWE